MGNVEQRLVPNVPASQYDVVRVGVSISFKQQIQLYSVYGTDWLYGNHGGLGRYGGPTFTPSMSSRGSVF